MSVSTSGTQIKTGPRAARVTVELLGSMRFAISLLVILAIASIIGTVLKQDDPYPNYVNQFGPFWADIFRSLGLYTVYGTWWFIIILLFLVVSVSLCVWRNGPKMIADMRSWKDRVREGSLRAFGHKAEYSVSGSRDQVALKVGQWVRREGYKIRHARNRWRDADCRQARRDYQLGYIFAHVAIIVICIGALLDSNLTIRLQMWLFDKSPVHGNAVISSLGPEHRMSPSNPLVSRLRMGARRRPRIHGDPERSRWLADPGSAIHHPAVVDYYSTGMPKLFASDIVITDRVTGQKIPARIEVNKPFTYRGIAIYQSSFEDGGSKLQFSAYPMSGPSAKPFAIDGKIGGTAPLTGTPDGDTIEFADFRAINVETFQAKPGPIDTRSVAKPKLEQFIDGRLGSGAQDVQSPRTPQRRAVGAVQDSR